MRPPNSVVDNLLAKHAEAHKQAEIVIENEKDYRAAVNRIFSRNDGKLLIKYLLKFSGIYNDSPQINPAQLIEDKGKRAYYLKMIRPYLDKTLRMEIENQ